MSKLIKKAVGYRTTCRKCMAVFSFDAEDIRKAYGFSNMVYCPSCGAGNCVLDDHGHLDERRVTPIYDEETI